MGYVLPAANDQKYRKMRRAIEHRRRELEELTAIGFSIDSRVLRDKRKAVRHELAQLEAEVRQYRRVRVVSTLATFAIGAFIAGIVIVSIAAAFLRQ